MKDQLEALVTQMYKSGILYSEAVREFKKRFILAVLQENQGNQCKAARQLGMHRNTLSRTINELVPWIPLIRNPPARLLEPQFSTAMTALKSSLSSNPALARVRAQTGGTLGRRLCQHRGCNRHDRSYQHRNCLLQFVRTECRYFVLADRPQRR